MRRAIFAAVAAVVVGMMFVPCQGILNNCDIEHGLTRPMIGSALVIR